ncbi:MAG: DJ-1/PfpI family protein [Akkermansiaceae bacterium]
MNNNTGQDPMMVVGFPLYPGCTLLDFAGATQMFAKYSGAGFEPVWLAQTHEAIETTEGVSVMPHSTFDQAPDVDILFVPGGGGTGVSHAMLDEAFLSAIDELAEKATWVGSVCTGAFILAATGRLNGCKATTYWSQLHNLALFPDISVDVDHYPRGIIDSCNKVFSGGGISSSLDLALLLIQEIKGDKICATTELIHQYAPEPPLNSGNPELAKAELTKAVLDSQVDFIKQMETATKEAIRRMELLA